MAKLKIGKLPVYKGEYHDDINYSRLNQVSYLGTTFQSLTDDNIGHPPAELSKDGEEIIFINTNYLVPGNYILFGIIIAALVIFNHRTNVKRLLKGNENKLSFKGTK